MLELQVPCIMILQPMVMRDDIAKVLQDKTVKKTTRSKPQHQAE